MVDYRIETITWYLEDNNIGHQKSFTKYYTLEKAIREGITRRNNLLEKAKAYGLANITGNHEVSGEPVIPNSYYFF
ncbi:MAG: hypothetical protein R3321_07195, partial [Nitrososphaeraceae archaeon]|nr:hypothetical protein [Nitrososphaeraceae archaeon]